MPRSQKTNKCRVRLMFTACDDSVAMATADFAWLVSSQRSSRVIKANVQCFLKNENVADAICCSATGGIDRV